MTLRGHVSGPATRVQRVLIVDSDAQSARQLVAELRRWGCDPIEATSFEEGKRLWTAEKPPMLIVDVCLGQFNGLQLLLRARSDRPDVRAIITCGFPDKVLEAETTRFGGTFLVKPLSPAQVMAILGPPQPAPQEVIPVPFAERRVADRRQLKIPDFVPDRRVGDRRRPIPSRGVVAS